MSYPLTEEESRRRSVNVDRDDLQIVLDYATDMLHRRNNPTRIDALGFALSRVRRALVAAKVAKREEVR